MPLKGLSLLLTVAFALCTAGCKRAARPDGSGRPGAVSSPATTKPAARALSEPPPTAVPRTDLRPLRLLTYNVLASPIFPELRMRAVFALLERAQADVIALQEVASWMRGPLLAEAWVQRSYHVTMRGGEPYAPGGQLILARYPIDAASAAVLLGDQRRTVLLATMTIEGRRFAVATTHLESYLDDGPVRARQLDAIFPLLDNADDAVLMGDLNFGEGAEPETSHLDRRYRDVWRALRPAEPGFTWNNEQNPIARIGAFAAEPSRRLDRILLRSTHWRPEEVSIIGDRSAGQRRLRYRERAMIEPRERKRADAGEPPIEVFPSDHYGLLAVLEPTD